MPNTDKQKTMKTILITATLVLLTLCMNAQEFVSNTGSVSFVTPKDPDVSATSQSLTSKINLDTKEIIFSVPVQALTFANAKMQQHFNAEKVMNSAEFPKAKFVGTIVTEESLDKDGEYAVMVEGEMTIKGSTQPYTAEGTLTVSEGKIEVISSFTINGFVFGVDSKDFGDVVEVTLNAVYE